MNGLIVGIACILGTPIVICAFFLIGVAIWQYCDGRYGENPFELFCDYFYEKGEKHREKMPPPDLAKGLEDLNKRLQAAQAAFRAQKHKKKGSEEDG